LKLLSLIACTLLMVLTSLAGFGQNANFEFVENKGQWEKNIRFKGVMNNGAFFLQEKGFVVVQHKAEDLQQLADLFHITSTSAGMSAKATGKDQGENKVTVRSHAYSVEFVNAASPVVAGDKPVPSYNNYFLGNDPAKWKGNCNIYQAVTYQNIYPGIDVRYYTNEGQLKYDIIVNAGADLSRLVMKYEGVDALGVKNEQLLIKTSVGDTHEMEPVAYQIVNGQRKSVECRFKVAGNTVGFSVGKYVSGSTLVIDPVLVFSTFTGSTADNWGYTATYGADGSFYAGGIAFSTGFPASTGAYQSNYGGGVDDVEGLIGFDIGIMKFSADGKSRIYGTFLGGNGNEYPHSLIEDQQGELVMAGRTTSANYPVKSPTFGGGGNYDIVLTKFNASGTALVGSRKIGGAEMDGVNIRPKYLAGSALPAESLRRNYGDDSRSEVILDGAGNILLASSTQSVKFPTTAGAFQNTLGGKQDGVVIKTSPDLSNILFSSYLGGDDNDAAFVLAINPTDNNIYVGGNTVSKNLPGDKGGVLQSAFQGGETDGFVSILTAGGQLLKTTYLGTGGNDMLYGIQFDRFSFPYVMGTTTGSWPVVNARFSQTGGRQFISKLKPGLSGYEYSTVFGTNNPLPNISPIAFLVDRCENVYVSGWGGSIDQNANYPNAGTAGLSVTGNALQSTTDGSDFYFFVLERNATSQLYGSFFGQNGGAGEHVDGGTSRFDRNGVIYQAFCANCLSRPRPAFPTTPGVWSVQNGATNCNLAAVKIAFDLAGVVGSVRSSIKGSVTDTAGCVPLTVDFADTLAEGKNYIWNFDDGTGDIATTTPTTSHTYNAVGEYRVRLVSIDSAKCNVADTAYTNIKVRTYKALLDFKPEKLEPCDAFNYQFSNLSVVSPAARSFSANSFKWNFGDKSPTVVAGTNNVTHNFPGPGTYNVKLLLNDTTFCNSPDSLVLSLKISTNVKAAFLTPQSGCAPYNAVFNNSSAGGQQFSWNFGDGSSSAASNPQHLYTIPGSYIVSLNVIDSATCNVKDSVFTTIVVTGKPIASISFSPDPPLENTPVQFFNSSIGANRYKWLFGDGDSLITTSSSPIEHVYNATDTFNTCLVATNIAGCSDTTCKPVAARIVALLDVPNAFTPNNDGVNDKVFVRGFGIRKMIWRIYNRWGVLVYETADRTQGWDGSYKGSVQSKDVYHYTLDVEFSDNSTYHKTGDITLLR
jgi:gliding motility-associated-like protein